MRWTVQPASIDFRVQPARAAVYSNLLSKLANAPSPTLEAPRRYQARANDRYQSCEIASVLFSGPVMPGVDALERRGDHCADLTLSALEHAGVRRSRSTFNVHDPIRS